MAIQWQVQSHHITHAAELIEQHLRDDWEPFAVYDGELWMRRHIFTEDNEPKSSTKPENAQHEPDLG